MSGREFERDHEHEGRDERGQDGHGRQSRGPQRHDAEPRLDASVERNVRASRLPVEDERSQRILGASLGGETDDSLEQLLTDRPELGAHLEDLGEAATSLDGAARLARDVLDEVDREASRASGGAKDDPHHESIACILRERATASAEAAAMRGASGTRGGGRGSSRWRWILLAASVIALAWIGFETVLAPPGHEVAPGNEMQGDPILLGDADSALVAASPRGVVDAVGEFAWTSSLSLPVGGYFEIRVYEGEQPRADRRLLASRALEVSPWTVEGAETRGWRGTLCWEVVAYVPAATDPVERSAPVVFELR